MMESSLKAQAPSLFQEQLPLFTLEEKTEEPIHS